MAWLLRAAETIDRLNRSCARFVRWGLLANAVLITVNALSRKLFAVAWPTAFDLQWHFFAAVALLMAAYTFQRDEHVRIDVFANRLSERGLAWLDLIGIVFVLIPICFAMVWLTTPEFIHSLVSGETRATRESSSALPAWIIRGLIPSGFFLLGLQGVAEMIRCTACIQGKFHRPAQRHRLVGETRHG